MLDPLRIRAAALAVAALLALHGLSIAQVIQKWKTPGGGLYFGDRPPPGSTKIGQEGSPEPAAPVPAEPVAAEAVPGAYEAERETRTRTKEADTLSIEASRERTAIERAMNASAARLEEVKRKIGETERLPDDFSQRLTNYASGQATKPDALRSLRAEEQELLAEIATQWKNYDKLNERVQKGHGGTSPDWWRGKPSCSACPSRSEAESALE